LRLQLQLQLLQKLKSRGRRFPLQALPRRRRRQSRWRNSCAKTTLARRWRTTKRSSSAQRRSSRLQREISATRTTSSSSRISSRRRRESAAIKRLRKKSKALLQGLKPLMKRQLLRRSQSSGLLNCSIFRKLLTPKLCEASDLYAKVRLVATFLVSQ